MAYEVSSSVANSSFTIATITETHSNKDYRGGIFSPDGTKLFVPTGRCEASFAGDTDKGVDIWSSSSASGWSLTDSFETNQPSSTNRRVSEIHPLSNTTALLLVGAGSNTGYVLYASSGSSGWDTTNIGELHSDYTFQYSGRGRMILNPSKTIGIIYDQGDEEISTVVSGSSGWSLSTSDTTPASLWGADWNGAVWVDDSRVFVFNDNGAGGAGQIDIYELTSGETGLENSHWTKIDGLYGNSSAAKGLGAGMYYHTASTTFLAIGGDGSTDPLNGPHSAPTGVDLYSWKSSSADGFLPNSYTDLTTEVEDTVGWNATGYVIDTRAGSHGGDTFFVFGNPDTAASDNSDNADIVVFESGSSGWKGTVVSGSGAYISYNTSTVSHQGVDTNNGFRIAYADPSYNSSNNPGRINIMDFHVSDEEADTTKATYSAAPTMAANNSTVDVTFSEAVYDTAGGSGALEAADFVLSISGGTATLSSATPTSISNPSGNVWRLGVGLSGTPNGSETLTVQVAANAIYDAAGNVTVSQTSNHTVSLNDQAGPTVSSVGITAASGAQNSKLNTGDTVDVTVGFSESVTIATGGGNPTLALSFDGTAKTATYNSGESSGANVVFRYTIQAGDTSDDGISILANQISIPGGSTIRDAAGNDATVTHIAVSANTSYKVDTTAPTISSLSMANDNSTVTVTFSEGAYNTAGGTGTLEIGDFTLSLSGGNAGAISLNSAASAIDTSGAPTVYVLTLNGTNLATNAAGTETLTVTPVDNNIYDQAGNELTATKSVSLNDTVPINDAITSTVGSGGGTIKAGKNNTVPNAELTVPSDALESNVSIKVDSAPASMSKTTAKSQLGTYGVGQDTKIVSEIVSLEPHGTSFKEDITLKVRLTGDSEGSCPTGLKVWKRAGPNDAEPWYPLPSDKYTCSNGVITIVTNTFSQYMATEGSDMGRTRLNDTQLEKIVSSNKVDGASLVLSGSTKSAKASVVDADVFLVQAATGAPVPVSASVMQNYFNATTGSTVNASMSVLFSQATGLGHAIDADGLVYNPSSELLTVGGAVTAGGNVTAVGSFIIGSADLNETDMEKLDGITNGTAAASKAVVLDASRDIGTIRNITSDGALKAATFSGSSTLHACGAATFGATLATTGSITAGTSFIIGSADLNEVDMEKLDGITNGTADASKALVLDGSKNIAGIGTVGCGAITSTGASSMGSLNVGGTLACDTSFTLDAVQVNATELGFIDGVTAGTAAASKAVVASAAKDVTGLRSVTASANMVANAFFGDGSGLTGVGAQVSNAQEVSSDLKLTFVSGTATAASFYIDEDSALLFNPGTETFKAPNMSGSGTLQVGGAVTAGGNVTAVGSFIIGSADMSETDLEKLDGITNGTADASKALVLDASKNISGIGTVGCGAITSTGASQMASLTLTGDLTVQGTTTTVDVEVIQSANGVIFEGTTNDNFETTLKAEDPTADHVYHLPDLGNTADEGWIMAFEANPGTSALITATPAELNVLDGVTAGTVGASLGVVADASKDVTGFRNVTATGAITAGTSIIIGSADLNEADMEKLDGITNGTAAASKAVVLDASRDIGTIRNITSDGAMKAATFSGSSTLHACGAATFGATLATTGSITAGTSFIIGSADLNEVDMEKLDGITNGTADASKALVLDGSKNIAGIGTVGCGAITSTGASTFGSVSPASADGGALGGSAAEWSDLFLADGGTVTFGNGQDIILTHVADKGLKLSTLAANNGAGAATSAGALAGFVSHVASDSPAAGDYLGGFFMNGEDGNDDEMTYASIQARIKDASDGSADGALLMSALVGDSLVQVADFGDTAASTWSFADGAYDVDVKSHDGTNGLKLGGTLVTSDASELNVLDGIADAAYNQAEDSVVFFDATDNKLKYDSANDFATAIAGGGGGLSAASGKIKITPVQQIFFSASQAAGGNDGANTAGLLTANMLTASLKTTNAILGNATSSGSLEVFLNGMLQTMSGSTETDMAKGRTAVYDYRVDNVSGVTKIYLESAMDEDDVLVVRYLKA